jgi:phosphocarrier protein
MYSHQVEITNSTGLHARPASDFVALAKKFKSKITIRNANGEGGTVNAKSIVLLLTMGFGKGTVVELAADGEDEKSAVDELVSLIESKFGEN